MIRELIWDSSFFEKRIGELKINSFKPSRVKSAIERAGQEGFQYLRCKITSQDTSITEHLESLGFYLTDIGVIFAIETVKFLFQDIDISSKTGKAVKVADLQDIPVLKKMIRGLFPESRFYNDPFFSKAEADRLYEAWIENSVKREAADIVFHIPNSGFVSCRKSGRHTGEIVLIGIKKGLRGKGFGTSLVQEAVRWFITQDIKSVSVRTQLKNLKALNFYCHLGFAVKEYDIIFGKVL